MAAFEDDFYAVIIRRNGTYAIQKHKLGIRERHWRYCRILQALLEDEKRPPGTRLN